MLRRFSSSSSSSSIFLLHRKTSSSLHPHYLAPYHHSTTIFFFFLLLSSKVFASSPANAARRRFIGNNMEDDDGFGGGVDNDNDSDEHDQFLANFDKEVESFSSSTSQADENALPSSSALQHYQGEVTTNEIFNEAQSGQTIAKLWPEILSLKNTAESPGRSLASVDTMNSVDDSFHVQRAVEISRNLVQLVDESSSEKHCLLDLMKVEDVAFCFGVLQSVVSKSGTRLHEKFVADASYRVFQADFDRRESNQNRPKQQDGEKPSALEVSITDDKCILATATATTLKSLIASEYINDDYLTGIGLSKSVDLVEEMDVPSLVSLLNALRTLNRTHFTFGEAEEHRKGAEGGELPTEKSSETQIDILSKAGYTDMGRQNHRADPKHYKPEAPSLAGLLKEAEQENINAVIHPNLIDLLAQGIEKRLRFLIKGAFAEMRQLEKQHYSSSSGIDHHQNLLPTPVSPLYKNKQEEDAMTMTITLLDSEEVSQKIEGNNPESEIQQQHRGEEERSIRNQKNNNHNRQSKQIMMETFIPICRSNELLDLISELCKAPSGTHDKNLWKDVSRYGIKYFEWANSLSRRDPITGRREMLFETSQLLKLLPPLVSPIQALNDPLDAIATARKKKSNFLVTTTGSSENENESDDNKNSTTATSLIPTFDLLSVVSNTLAKNPRHISIIGYRNPAIMKNLRRAFEEYPVLYETSPALWDVLRTSRVPKKLIGPVYRTGIPKKSGKLGQLPQIPMKKIEPKRILSKEIMQATNDPYFVSQKRHVRAASVRKTLESDRRINKAKDKKKRDHFSKGKYIATRLPEASHQSNMK